MIYYFQSMIYYLLLHNLYPRAGFTTYTFIISILEEDFIFALL